MMNIYIYGRDSGGLIDCHAETWDSAQDATDHYARWADMRPGEGQAESLLGWPTDSVRWYGNIGIGFNGEG